MNVAIVVAGGTGERIGIEGGKQLATVAGAPVLTHTLRAFETCERVDAIVVVVHPDRLDEYRAEAIDPYGISKVIAVVAGGETRQRSVAAGLAALPADATIVAVHDGARPLVTPDIIASAILALASDSAVDGVVVGHPSYDTLKRVDASGVVIGTLDRRECWIAQTPQVFRADAVKRAYHRAEAEGRTGTDDASLVEAVGGAVRMVAGSRENIKAVSYTHLTLPTN
jgi:2-C-methyl-D-erythritol 4-phosphate cytidylyltransferase